jgi:chemotaxis signal transduction protein
MNPLPTSTDLRLLRCEIGSGSFAFPMRLVRSIGRLDQVGSPDSSNPFLGKVRYGRREIPVYRLSALLNLKENVHTLPQVIILGEGASTWGLMVDRTSQLGNLRSEDLLPMPEFLRRRTNLYSGIVRTAGGLVLLLDPNQFNPDEPGARFPAIFPNASAAFDLPLPSMTRNQLVLCSLTEPGPGTRPIRFAFSTLQTLEIVDLPEVTPVPHAPAEMRGLIPWRDRYLALLDLREPLGLPVVGDRQLRRGLILRPSRSREPVAVMIHPSVRFVPGRIPHEPSTRKLSLRTDATVSVVEFEDQTVALLDADRFA